MTTKSNFLVLCILAIWTLCVGGVDSDSKQVFPSSTPEFQQVEKEEIQVTMPSITKIDDDSSDSNVPNDQKFSDSGTVGNRIKPRKGVSTDEFETSETYKVKEPQDEIHNPTKIVSNSNSTVSQVMSSVEKSNNQSTVVGKGTVTALDGPEKSQPESAPVPKKPKITYSPEDNPDILKFAADPKKLPESSSSVNSKLPVPDHIQGVEEPSSEFSKEFEPDDVSYGGFLGYIVISAMVLTFIAVPVVFGRKLKDYWHTRHYRRVDFLVDGMYNE